MKKRMLSLVLCLCMIFSMVPAINASAATTEVEVSLNRGGFQDNPRYLLYLDLAGATQAITAGSITATVNGTPTTLEVYPTDTASQVFVIVPGALGSYLVEIDAGTAIGSYTVKSDLKIKIADYTYTQLDIIRLGIDTSYDGSIAIPGAGGVARYSVNLSGISGYSGATPAPLLNGTAMTTGFEYYPGYPTANHQALFIYYDALKSGATDAGDITELQTISIPKGTIFGNCITENTLTFTIQQWTFNVLPEEVNITSTAGSAWNSEQYILYLHTDPSFTLTANQSVKIKVNDVEKDGYLYPGDTPFVAVGTDTAFGENKIVIPAGTKLGDCVTATDYTVYTHADGSIDQTPPADPKVNFTFASGVWDSNTVPNRYLVYFNNDFGSDMGVQWKPQPIVSVDGTDKNVYAFSTDTQLCLVMDNSVGIEAPGEHEVTLKKGTMIDGKYEIANDVTFYTHADGTVNLEAPKMTFTGVASGSWRSDYNDYYIILDTNNSSFALTANTEFDVPVDDGTARMACWTNQSMSQPNGKLVFTLNTTKGEHAVTIPAGTKLGDYTLEADFTFRTHADGTVDTYQQFGITGISTYNYRGNDYYIILNTDNTSFKQDDSPTFTNKGVTLEGFATSGYFWNNSASDVGKVILIVNGQAGETKVTIPAGTVLGGFKLRETFTFYTHADGTVDLLPGGKTPVNVIGINPTHSKYMTSGYHVYLDMTDPACAQNATRTAITVKMDGADRVVTLYPTEGPLLIDCDQVTKGYHNFTIPAGTEIGDYVLEKDYSFRTYSSGLVGEAEYGQVTLNNASAMMGGDYGDGLYYDFSGSFTGANWIVNATPVEGNITFEYEKISEAKDSAWYGPVRMTNLNNQWPNVFGVVLHTTNNTFANDYGLTNVHWNYNTEDHKAYYRNSAGNLQKASEQYGYISDWDTYMTDNKLATKDFAGIDAKGAQHFGYGWGGTGTHTVNWTKLMVYDAQGNDLGVAWHETDANVTLTQMVEYGKTVYLKAADHNGLPVTGWKVMDREGKQVTVNATQDTNGIWSFAVPEDTASIEPIYKSVKLTVKDPDGKVLVENDIHWLDENILPIAKQVENATPEGSILMGYEYDGKLYSSLSTIPVGEATQLEVTAATLALAVRTQGDIRHGTDLADSGLRFIAALGQTEYIPKALQIADNADFQNAKTVGNTVEGFKEIVSPNGTVSYSIALTAIPAVDYSKTYYARAGVLVTYAETDAEGKNIQNWIYSDVVATTVNAAAETAVISSEARTAFVDGVMNLDADANLVGERSYTVSANNAGGSYTVTYTGGETTVSGLIIDGLRFTAEDGVTFEAGKVTIPGGLFANAKLKKEMTATGTLDIGAYFGPAVGKHQYTESSGTVTDYSIKRTHDAVYADVEDYFNAGFNIWMAEDWVYGGTHYSSNDAFSALDLAAEYCLNHGLTNKDIQVLVADQFINGLLDGTDMNNADRNDVATYASLAEERINALISYQPTVNGQQLGAEYNCFAGYLLRDEPYYKHMKYYTGWFNFLAADEGQTANVTAWGTSSAEIAGSVSCMGLLSKGYKLYFSLLGMSAPQSAILENSDSSEDCTQTQYVAYVKAFVDNVNATVWNHDNMTLAFDNYGLYSEAKSSFGSTSVSYTEKYSENWQQNMAYIADLVKSKNPDATFGAALRSFGMTRKYMVSKWSSKTWKEYQAFGSDWGEQAVSMQAYTALAHGYDYVNWFSYWETQNQAYGGETFTDACVMWDDNMNPVKQNLYYWVQSANAELRSIENLISNFSYQDTAAVGSGSGFYTGTGNVADTGMGGLSSASALADASALASISASKDTTVGYYSKGSGEFTDMFVLANMSHPNQNASDDVTMTFDGGYTAVIVYLDGVASIHTLANNAYTVTLPSGEGAIVIPVK